MAEELQSDLADGDLSRSDLALIRQAANNKWQVNPALFKALPDGVGAMFLDKDNSNRERIAAAKTLVDMVKNNGDDELSTDVTVNIGVQVAQANAIQKELLDEPEYLDYLRTRAIEIDTGDASSEAVTRPVENGEAPRAARPGTNGDRAG